MHLDHINGINDDNRLENLRFLCPNCHSLTDTYCGKSNKSEGHYNKNKKKVTDKELIESIKNSNNIKEALDVVGMAGANNYVRVKKLAEANNLLHIFKHTPAYVNKEKIKRLKRSNIDYTKYGWVTAASKILGISPQNTRKFVERNAPELLENANIRK